MTNFSLFATNVASLKTDLRSNPLGFDNTTPSFSWIMESNERGFRQLAYEILVSEDSTKFKKSKSCIWSSGKVVSNLTNGIKYQGKLLQPFTRYYWKVRIYVQNGQPSSWSSLAWFETSMLKATDWKGQWISDHRPIPSNDEDFYKETPNTLLRKDFSLNKQIKSARLYIAGLGYPITFINGKRVGDHMLDMPWTQFGKQVLYSTFDVTDMLAKGDNAIGVMLGDGWYNPKPIKLFTSFNVRDVLTVGKNCVKAQILVKYTDGSSTIIKTDDTWKTGEGPVLMNSVYLGETYDARLEQKNWNNKGFDDSSWSKATMATGPAGELIAQYIPPIRITKVLKAIKMTEPKPGVYIFDFGQNFGGNVKLNVKGASGDKVILTTGEDLHPDGTLNFYTVIAGMLKSMWNLNGGPGCPPDPKNTITYTLNGSGLESYTPQFSFTSLRYVQVTGFPGRPDLSAVEGLRMNTDVEEVGDFCCSNEMFNKIQDITKWTFLSNLFSIQSDCPAREKLGYGADIVVSAEAYSYNYDMSSFYRKVTQDFVNDVRPLGGMTEIAPNIGINSESMGDDTGSPGWQLAFPYAMKVLHDFYGDKQTLEKNYNILKRQVDFMHSVSPNHIVYKCISDHVSIDPKPVPLTATAFYYAHVVLLNDFIKVLNKTADKEKYIQLAEDIKVAFLDTFLKKGTGIFDSGTQAAQLFAFYYDVVPENEKSAAFNQLILEIFNKHQGHLSTGIFATKFMFDYFRTINRNDVAYTIANQRNFPSWGNMIANGATTLYENWQYPTVVDSQNHPMFGSISEWFYRSLLGINTLAPGFTTFEIKPQPTGDLTWAKGHYNAITGRIACEWKIEKTRFKLKISVPANTIAMVYVPSLKDKTILEGGQEAAQTKGLLFKEYKDHYAVFEVQSGNYEFESTFDK